MKFTYKDFSCDVDIFYSGDDILLRFYDSSKEQTEKQIHDLVIVDSGYGFLCLKVKGGFGLLSGYLDRAVFSDSEVVDAALEFLESLSPKCRGGCIPNHVDLVDLADYTEYNGEY